jgi:hypothetical protein
MNERKRKRDVDENEDKDEEDEEYVESSESQSLNSSQENQHQSSQPPRKVFFLSGGEIRKEEKVLITKLPQSGSGENVRYLFRGSSIFELQKMEIEGKVSFDHC